jgi:cytochrome c-type biogenesis protein CcmH
MNSVGSDWAAPLLVLAAGLGMGALLLWRVRRTAVSSASFVVPPLELRDLAGKRDSLVRQLREMEDTVSRWTDPIARERYALELELARVLLALEEHRPAPGRGKKASAKVPGAATGVAPPSVASATDDANAARPALPAFLWGAGSAGALGLLLFLVWQAARPRPEDGSLTGNTTMDRPESSSPSPDSADEEASIRAALARDPGDIEAHLALARVRLGRRDFLGVWEETQYVLGRSPGNPRALSYQSVVHLAMGKPELAEDELKRALATEPDLLDAHRYLAFVYLRMGREKDAEATITNASRRFPTLGPKLAEEFREMRRKVAAEGGRAGGDQATRPGAAEGGGRAQGGRAVTLVLDLEPALRGQVAPGSVLFVTVREAGVEKGPPVAAKRLAAGVFPMTVTVDDSDSMAGEPLPANLRIETRIDSDGDPMTRSASDPSARVDGVKAGASGVRLVLKR